jgi:hypothetical protein
MKKILMVLIALGIVVQLSAKYEDGSGFIIEVGGGLALAPYESKLSDGVFEVNSLQIEPEQFSKAMNNDKDAYLMVGAILPVQNDLSLIIGGRIHMREAVNYEADFTAAISKQLSKSWSGHIGGGFGTGNLNITFDKITFDTGDVIDYPDKMDFQTAFCHIGIGYKISSDWSLLTTYEIKEISVDGDDLKEQIDFKSINSIGVMNSVSSYESTTHSLYLSLKYTF